MRRVVAAVGVALGLTFGSAAVAHAQVISITARDAALIGPVRTIVLNTGAVASGAVIGDKLANQDLTFDGAVRLAATGDLSIYNVFTRYGADAIANGLNYDLSDVITIRFDRPVQAAAFNAFAFQFDPLTLQPNQKASLPELSAYRTVNGVDEQVGSFQGRVQDAATLVDDPNAKPPLDWWTFDGGLFDAISLRAPVLREPGQLDFVQALYLANLQVIDQPEPVETTVPEPARLGLLGIGAVLLLLRRRRAI